MSRCHLVNPDLQAQAIQTLAKMANAREKRAFIPVGGQGAPGGDPSAGGGAPPDPSAGGAPPPGGPPMAPPPDPSAGGGGGQDPGAIAAAVAQTLSPMMQGGMGGAGGGGVEPLKPKIDVNVTLMQILKMLARITDAMGIPVPASEMVANSTDLTQFAQQQAAGQAMPAGGASAGGGGAGPASSIPPISPIGGAGPGMGGGQGKIGTDQPAQPFNNGSGYAGASDRMEQLNSKAAAAQLLVAHRARNS